MEVYGDYSETAERRHVMEEYGKRNWDKLKGATPLECTEGKRSMQNLEKKSNRCKRKNREKGNPPKKNHQQQKLLNTSRNAEKSSIYETGEKERENEQERERNESKEEERERKKLVLDFEDNHCFIPYTQGHYEFTSLAFCILGTFTQSSPAPFLSYLTLKLGTNMTEDRPGWW